MFPSGAHHDGLLRTSTPRYIYIIFSVFQLLLYLCLFSVVFRVHYY